MKHENDFLIPFVGLKLGKHSFEYQIDNTFFKKFDFDEYENINVKIDLIFDKKSTFMELNFKHKGSVNVACDTTGEMFDLPIKGKIKLVVQFGEEFNNDNDELLIIPFSEHQLDISQYIYEMIVLSVPIKRMHPGIKDGTLQSDVLDKLNELRAKKLKEEVTKEEAIDPRWDKLKQLLTDK